MFSLMTSREYENISHFLLFYSNQNTVHDVERNTFNDDRDHYKHLDCLHIIITLTITGEK